VTGRGRRPRGIARWGLVASIVPAAVVALAFVGPPKQAPVPLGPTLRGIDASHYQGAIVWRAVAAAGYRFVYLKATEGRGHLDPTFRRNRRRAAAAGLLVGAYHFARPDASPGDAVIEADAFLRVARPIRGELAPILDLEVTGGLSPSSLQRWVRAWLERVRAATGVRPLVYAGSTFWRVRMANSFDFASYPLAWASHEPGGIIPAGDWSSFGWTLRQWSICGRVPGVRGCVDLDLLREDRLRLIRVP
jgi:GH25 family lysozyme M1 (1,4-beta-N-acetylmuramidase)